MPSDRGSWTARLVRGGRVSAGLVFSRAVGSRRWRQSWSGFVRAVGMRVAADRTVRCADTDAAGCLGTVLASGASGRAKQSGGLVSRVDLGGRLWVVTSEATPWGFERGLWLIAVASRGDPMDCVCRRWLMVAVSRGRYAQRLWGSFVAASSHGDAMAYDRVCWLIVAGPRSACSGIRLALPAF